MKMTNPKPLGGLELPDFIYIAGNDGLPIQRWINIYI